MAAAIIANCDARNISRQVGRPEAPSIPADLRSIVNLANRYHSPVGAFGYRVATLRTNHGLICENSARVCDHRCCRVRDISLSLATSSSQGGSSSSDIPIASQARRALPLQFSVRRGYAMRSSRENTTLFPEIVVDESYVFYVICAQPPHVRNYLKPPLIRAACKYVTRTYLIRHRRAESTAPAGEHVGCKVIGHDF